MFINLVATRCKDGNHAMLLRWYNDHVHILFGFAALQQASLYRALDGSTDHGGRAPPYLCLYEFPTRADFEAFEIGAPREAARQVLLGGWGKDGIEIVWRPQFERIMGRRGPPLSGMGTEASASNDVCLVQHLQLGSAPLAGAARWLNDRAHALLPDDAYLGADLYRSAAATDAGGGALVMGHRRHRGGAQSRADGTTVSLGDGPVWAPGPDAWGEAPATVTLDWQANYQRLRTWSR
jgi:hypothetical protein